MARGLGPLYPINLDLTGRSVLVVGGGPIAARKIAGLVECGAEVTVVAPEVSEEARQAMGPTSRTVLRPFCDDDVDGKWLVMTATGVGEIDAAVRGACDARSVFVNSADDPANCTATLPATLRQGDLVVAFSTSGRAPGVSSLLRSLYAAEVGPEHQVLIELISEARDRLHAQGRSTEDLDWQGVLRSGTLELIREGDLATVKERLEACLLSSSD